MPSPINRPLFQGVVLSGATKYVPIPVTHNRIGLTVAWRDAVSSATITMEYSDFDAEEAPHDAAGSAWHWKASGVAITGPSAAAASSALVESSSVLHKRARLVIVAAANCDFDIRNGL